MFKEKIYKLFPKLKKKSFNFKRKSKKENQ